MTMRLDRAMVERGLARSRSEAADLIASGIVTVQGGPVIKAATKVSAEARIEVTDDQPRYVSRAGRKLAGALDVFKDIDPTGRRCLDAGASTGGFTDVLLRRGADRVLAVDVGHEQLVDSLSSHPRVDVHEGLNIREITPELVGGPVDLVVSDLSFISLQLTVGPLAGMCLPSADLVLMVKPQFEVGRSALPRTGVVTDPEARRAAVHGVIAAARAVGLEPVAAAGSTVAGQDGNLEFFLHLRHSAVPGDSSTEAWLDAQNIDWTNAGG
ncbi:MAG: TlyA family RNA methyltransferase [Micrococcaceae bacterium]